jgi:hypothetical protein
VALDGRLWDPGWLYMVGGLQRVGGMGRRGDIGVPRGGPGGIGRIGSFLFCRQRKMT